MDFAILELSMLCAWRQDLKVPLSTASFSPMSWPVYIIYEIRSSGCFVQKQFWLLTITSYNNIQHHNNPHYGRAADKPTARVCGLSCSNNCKLAFVVSVPVWLSHRAIITILPRVRLGLQGETKWSCVITFSTAFSSPRKLYVRLQQRQFHIKCNAKSLLTSHISGKLTPKGSQFNVFSRQLEGILTLKPIFNSTTLTLKACCSYIG